MKGRIEVIPVFPVIAAGENGLVMNVLEMIANPPPLRKNWSERRKWRDFGFCWHNNLRPGRVVCGKHGHQWARLTLKRCYAKEAGCLFLTAVIDYEDRRAIRLIVGGAGDSATTTIELNAVGISGKKIPRIADMVVAHAIHGKAFSLPMPREERMADVAASE
jgi:hypothetical protein